MKRCPQCGRVYGADALYCDQDGMALRRARRLFPYLLAGGAILIVAGAAAAPGLLRSYLSGHISVQLTDISLHANPSFGWPPFRPYADVVFKIRNTAPVSPALHSVRLQCGVAGEALAALEWPGAGELPLAVAGGADTEVKLRLTPQAADLGQVFRNLPQNRECRCAGPVVVSLWGLAVSRELAASTNLW